MKKSLVSLTVFIVFVTILTTLLSSCCLSHEWREATCIEPKTCVKCGETEGTSLGHTWKSATCTTPKTCTRCSKIEGSALGHDWKAATCTTPKTCNRCGKTEGPALGHDWKAATCTTPKTCNRCGKTEGTAEHDWQGATCLTPKTCRKCGKTEGSSLGHNWKSATCTSAKTCSRCGKTEGSALGHNYVNYKCARCGQNNLTKNDIPNIIDIDDLRCPLNSVGGVKQQFNFTNKSKTKTIKYLYISISYYNAVGDIIANKIGGEKFAVYKLTGPIKPNEKTPTYQAVTFYSGATINTIKINYITIEYTDGTTLTIDYPLTSNAVVYWRK